MIDRSVILSNPTPPTAAVGEVVAEGDGRAGAARDVILLLVAPRFGAVPPDFRQRLEAIDDVDLLHHLLECALEVDSLDELAAGLDDSTAFEPGS